MTESEWLACQDPQKMIAFLRGKATDRKLWLAGCAFCRRVWDLVPDRRSRHAIEATERFADGNATVEEVSRSRADAEVAYAEAEVRAALSRRAAACASFALGHAPEWEPARWPCIGSVATQSALSEAFSTESQGKNRKERKRLRNEAHARANAAQCDLLKDLMGCLSRWSSRALQPPSQIVCRLAQAAYEMRDLPSGYLDPARLAVLSDALEEAGCDSTDLLSHLRSPGPHVRGCWALDLILGKS